MLARAMLLIGPIALMVAASTQAAACDEDRYLCEPKAVAKPSTVARAAAPAQKAIARPDKKSAIQVVPGRLAANEKAPPDLPRPTMVSPPARAWMPIDVPSLAVQPNEDPEAANISAADRVSVVSADELNEVDLAALSVPETVKVVPIRVVWPYTPAARAMQATTPPPAPAPVDTSLLERVLLTFGGAFGAASALRIFVG